MSHLPPLDKGTSISSCQIRSRNFARRQPKTEATACAKSRSITGPIQTCAYTCSVKKRSHPLRSSTRMAQSAPTRESSGGCDRRAWKIREEQIKGLAGEELCVGSAQQLFFWRAGQDLRRCAPR